MAALLGRASPGSELGSAKGAGKRRFMVLFLLCAWQPSKCNGPPSAHGLPAQPEALGAAISRNRSPWLSAGHSSQNIDIRARLLPPHRSRAKPPPGLSISNQPQPKGLPQRVTRLQQRGITLTVQQVTQSDPSQLNRELKSFHQPLLFALIQRRWLEEGFQLRQGFLVVGEAL